MNCNICRSSFKTVSIEIGNGNIVITSFIPIYFRIRIPRYSIHIRICLRVVRISLCISYTIYHRINANRMTYRSGGFRIGVNGHVVLSNWLVGPNHSPCIHMSTSSSTISNVMIIPFRTYNPGIYLVYTSSRFDERSKGSLKIRTIFCISRPIINYGGPCEVISWFRILDVYHISIKSRWLIKFHCVFIVSVLHRHCT